MIDLLVDALAAYRLTRLATRDTITEPVRDWIAARSMRHVPSNAWAGVVEPDVGTFVGNVCRCGHLRLEHGGAAGGCDVLSCQCVAYDRIAAASVEPVSPWSFVADALDCGWCTSVWAAGVVLVLPRPLRRLLAAAAVAGVLGSLLDSKDDD